MSFLADPAMTTLLPVLLQPQGGMTYQHYRMMRDGRRLVCTARTRAEARAIFKAMLGITGRLRAKVRVARTVVSGQ